MIQWRHSGGGEALGLKTHDAPTGHTVLGIPINGTASDVVGIFSATRLRNTVNESSMVTPEIKRFHR